MLTPSRIAALPYSNGDIVVITGGSWRGHFGIAQIEQGRQTVSVMLNCVEMMIVPEEARVATVIDLVKMRPD